MRDRYIAPAVMLVAGAITSILNIINNVEFLKGLERLLVVLILFYIIGRIAAVVIKKATRNDKKSSDTEESSKAEENSIAEENSSDTEEETVTEDAAEVKDQ